MYAVKPKGAGYRVSLSPDEPVSGVTGSVSLLMPEPVFNITGGVVTDYPIGVVSFTIDKPSFKDNVYSNSFSNGYLKQAAFSSGIIKQSGFIGVNK